MLVFVIICAVRAGNPRTEIHVEAEFEACVRKCGLKHAHIKLSFSLSDLAIVLQIIRYSSNTPMCLFSTVQVGNDPRVRKVGGRSRACFTMSIARESHPVPTTRFSFSITVSRPFPSLSPSWECARLVRTACRDSGFSTRN